MRVQNDEMYINAQQYEHWIDVMLIYKLLTWTTNGLKKEEEDFCLDSPLTEQVTL